MIKRLAATLVVIALIVLPVLADKVVNTNVVSVTQSEIVEISIINDESGGLDAVIVYRVLDDAGNVYLERAVVRFALSTPDKAKLNAFINTAVLPAVNAAEGL